MVILSKTNSYARSRDSKGPEAPADYLQMLSAINLGVFQPVGDLTNALSLGCISGNCTFSAPGEPAFSTLAIRQSCSDLTSRIRIINQTNESASPDSSSNSSSTFLGLDYGPDNIFAWSKEHYGPVLNTFTYDNYISSFATIYFVFRSGFDTQDWKAVNCTIRPNIDTYTASINNAILEETLTETVPLQMLDAQFKEPPVIDTDYSRIQSLYSHLMATNYTVRDGVRRACEGAEKPAPNLTKIMKSSTESTYVNATGHTNPSAGWKWWYHPNDCVWSIHNNPNMAIRETLEDVFNNKEAEMDPRRGVTGPTQLRVLFENGDITFSTVKERMKLLTTSMTFVVRINGGGSLKDSIYTQAVPQVSQGDVWINTTCVAVRWKWMVFPAVMIALTGVFLLLVVIENRGVENDRLWKSSFLAALFCEVHVHETPAGKEEMYKIAKSTSVSIEGKSGRLGLVAG
jgi:hypothetical protein